MSERRDPPQRQDRREDHRMGPTRPATLLVAMMVTGALSWILVATYYADLPRMPWLPPLMMLALAIGEGALAWSTKARIDRRPGAAPVDPLAVARYVVLAKASSLAGSIFTGLFAGVLVWLLVRPVQLTAANADVPPAAAGLVGALCMVAAALLLERACRVPKRPDDGDSSE